MPADQKEKEKKMNDNMLISVIIPVYNTEKYLDRCMESVVNQTYQNLEIILIDDGSTDGSVSGCRRWLELDARVVLVSKHNEGLGPTRNLGIRMSRGECLAFVDCDDWVKETFIEMMVSKMEVEGADVVFCDYALTIFDDGEKEYSCKSGRRFLHYKGTANLQSNPELLSRISPVTWNKLVRRELLISNDITQPVCKYEDLVYTYKLLRCAKKIAHVKEELYYYWINRKSSIQNSSADLMLGECFLAIEEALVEIELLNPSIECYLQFEKYASCYLSLPLKRLKSEEQYGRALERYYTLFPDGKRIDSLKFAVFGSRNTEIVFERVRLFQSSPELRIGDINPIFYQGFEYHEKLEHRLTDIGSCDYILFDLCADAADMSDAYEISPAWRENVTVLAEYLKDNARGAGIFILDSRYALGEGLYGLERAYGDPEERDELNRILNQAVTLLVSGIPNAVRLAAPGEKLLFADSDYGFLLNHYWYYDKADEIRKMLEFKGDM